MKNYYFIRSSRISPLKEYYEPYDIIGADSKFDQDLTNDLKGSFGEFREKYRPIYQKSYPNKNPLNAMAACAFLWSLFNRIQVGDIVIYTDGGSVLRIGSVTGNYEYPTKYLNTRTINRYDLLIWTSQLSAALQAIVLSYNEAALVIINNHSEEIETFITGKLPSLKINEDEIVGDPSEFHLEKYLEDFLIKNWHKTGLGRDYDIFSKEGKLIGQQYPTDTGNIDILAVSKDERELLVIELKKGKTSDVTIGQIQRYMGYIQENIAKNGQRVRGMIIASEDDIRIRRALSVTKNIEFYRYEVGFKLFKHPVP